MVGSAILTLLSVCVAKLTQKMSSPSTRPYAIYFSQKQYEHLIIKVWIVRVVVDVNVVVILVVIRLIVLLPIGQVRRSRLLVIRSAAPHNSFTHTTNPIVFGRLRIGVQQELRFGGGNFQRVSLFGFQVRRFDRGARRQINHTVRARILYGRKDEFGGSRKV